MSAPLDVAEVERWFREATGNQPHRRRTPAIPPEGELFRIVWVIAMRTPTERNRQLQHALAGLKRALAEVPRDHPGMDSLIDLWDAACRVEPAPKQGQTKAWHAMARELEGCVRDALASVGRDGTSVKADGPLVKVILSALKSVDGEDHEGEAVASFLRRARAKGVRKK